ncbi:MAG: hypothetical protein TREMPRED_004909, partial [Tremellales sp. Tagirdzhanova-0007]
SPTGGAAIQQIYDRLRARFDSFVTYSIDYRIYNLKQLAYLIKDNELAIHTAMKQDLDEGAYQVNIAELYTTICEIDLAVKRLPEWMADERRLRDARFAFKFMNPRIRKQPKGIALPSELAPNSAKLLAELIPRYLDPDGYAVVCGGADRATRLLEKQWGHILYTGSGSVGKIVATAAAKTLTPTTLELGGKSPVIISSCADVDKAARRMTSIKQLCAGQICVCPDYVLCSSDRVDDFISACTETLNTFFPPDPSPQSILHTPMSASLLQERHFERQQNMLEKAQLEGKVVYRGESDKQRRRMGVSLVKLDKDGIGETGSLVEDEIFGPVLPIIPVQDLDAAIRYINVRPHPLAF